MGEKRHALYLRSQAWQELTWQGLTCMRWSNAVPTSTCETASLPPHTTAKQSVSGRCRGSRGAGSLPRQAGRAPGLCSTATASEPHHSNTPRVKTKHQTPYLPGLYKKLKVKEEKNNVISGEEEAILLPPHNTRCVLPFDNVQRRRNSSMRPEAGTGQEGSRGPARRCRAALRLQTCIGTYYRCSFTVYIITQ